jgi:uncharacterized protein YbjT (DUF2867 family)
MDDYAYGMTKNNNGEVIFMEFQSIHAVTGAFGYSGKYITRKLIADGHPVVTLTNSVDRKNEFGNKIKAYPLDFTHLDELKDSLQGVEILYNTYWVRFDRPPLFTHTEAVRNSIALFKAAKKAGVQRIVHVSITNPSLDSKLPYFHGKAEIEQGLISSGVPHTILRPTVLFGQEDILINNIAWTLRHLPVMGVFGNGQYRVQPIYVEDLAELAVRAGKAQGNEIINAIGPETFSYRELVQTIGQLIGVQRPIIAVPPEMGYWAGWAIGKVMNDVFITRAEIAGLMQDLLYVGTPPTGTTKLTEWIIAHRDTLGRRYTSEMSRRLDRHGAYASN